MHRQQPSRGSLIILLFYEIQRPEKKHCDLLKFFGSFTFYLATRGARSSGGSFIMLVAVKFRDQKRTHCEYLKEKSFLRVVPREYLNDESFLRVYLATRGAVSSVKVSLVLGLAWIYNFDRPAARRGGAAATNSRSCR